MALETGDYINDLVITNPASSDAKSFGDDHFRLVKKVAKQTLNGFTGGILLTATETGTAAAHVLTPTTALVGYTTGLMLLYRPTNAGTGALTVNVSGLGAKSVKMSNGSDPTSGDILVNQPLLLVYDGTNFVTLGGSAFLSKTGNQTLNGNLQIAGIAQVNGAATVGGTLSVTGASTFTGDIGGTGGDKKADKAGSVYTGTHDLSGAASVLVPTATLGGQATNLTQLTATAFSSALPSQTGNAGKFVTTNGTSASWAFAGISQVTTATTATTLTNTPTLLQITPTSYGVTVTLPDATTCSVGGPLHCIDNRGAFPVRVCNTSGTLLGFVFAGVVSYISLDNNSTAAGVWAASAAERVGISAAYKYTGTVLNAALNTAIDLGSGRELLWGSTTGYAVVYDRTTNTFGAPTLIRAAANNAAVLMSTDKVLYCSSDGSTGFEAVVLSITGTSIAVGTPVTATLSAGSNGWPTTYSALSLVGTSAVVSYPVSGPTCEIRAITVSGTVPTIGAATVLDGTTGGLGAGGHGGIGMVASSSVIIYASYTPAGNLYTKPYTISGTTITPGTGTNTSGGTMLMHKFYPLGTRWVVVYSQAGTSTRMLLVSLSGTTTTVSVSIPGLSVYTTLGTDAAVIGTTKSLIIGSTGTGALLLDTAGTASATTVSITGGAILWVSGTDVAVQDTDGSVRVYDCSTSTAVLSKRLTDATTAALFVRSDVTLGRSATALRSGALCRNLYMDVITQTGDFEVSAADVKLKPKVAPRLVSTITYSRGLTDAAAWFTDAQTAGTIYKLECAA